jgi:hypothetical protein
MTLGVPGLRGRLTKISHPLANLCGDARFSKSDAEAMIARMHARGEPGRDGARGSRDADPDRPNPAVRVRERQSRAQSGRWNHPI